MFLLLGAGLLIAIAALIFEKTGHLKSEGESWFNHCSRNHPIISNLSEIIPGCVSKTVQDENPDDFTYKTYDSRVLYSRYNNVNPSMFYSEPRLSERRVWETRSLPDFQKHLPTNPTSKSCHNLGAIDSKSQATSMDRPIVFGSVGSILMTKHCKEVLSHTYLYDRPQTSVF